MDFLTFLQQQAVNGGDATRGPGTPGYIAAQLSGLTSTPYDVPPPVDAPETDTGGGFWDAINPSEIGINLGAIGSSAIDILSRPSYAVNNMLQETARRAGESQENGFQVSDILSSLTGGFTPGQAWQGISGQQKVLGADVIDTAVEESGGNAEDVNPWVKGIGGLGIDIFADPTTYLGVGAIKGIATGATKGVKALAGGEKAVDAIAEASKVTDEAAQAITESAIKRRMIGPEEAPGHTIHPGQGTIFDDEDALFNLADGGVRQNKQLQAAIAKTEPTAATKADDVFEQGDLFDEGPTALKETPTPKVEESPAPKIVADAPKLTTADVPWAKAQIVDRTKGFLQTVKDYSQMPVPVGSRVSQLEGAWMQPGSTNAYARAGAHAVNNAEEIVYKSENFHDIHAAGKTPEQMTEAYKAGAIRPPLDTPAERALMDAVGTTDLRGVGTDPLAHLDFFAVPDQFKALMLAEDGMSKATVFSASGTPRSIPAKKLWDILHGGETNVDLNNLFIRNQAGRKISVAGIVKKNKEALADPEFWRQAAKQADMIKKDPRGFAERIMKQNVDHLRKSEKMAYDDFAEWAADAKKLYPELSSAALKAAHDAAKKLLNKLWEKAVVNNPRGTVSRFMTAQHASTQLREVMAEAIARNSPAEELVTDIATVEHNFDITNLNEDLNKLLASAAEPEAKAAAVTAVDQAAKDADETLAAAQREAAKAPAEREAKAQAASSNVKVAEQAREVKNYNEIVPNAQSVLDGTSWGSTLSKDQAVGIIRGAVGSMIKTMMRPKNVASFHHMNQTGMLNKILGEIGLKGKNDWKAVIRRKGAAKSVKNATVIETSRRISNLMRAAEHQMDEAAGFMPNVWNGGNRKARGWRVGSPGVEQTVKDADNANIPFSSSHLMDEMIDADYRKVAEGGEADNLLPRALFGSDAVKQSALWTKVVEAAVFKNKSALDSIKDPVLKQWLKDYDPTENLRWSSEKWSGKQTEYIKAQETAAEKHVADAKLNDSPARAAKVEAETKGVAKETVQRDPTAPVEDAEAIGDSAHAAASDLARAIERVSQDPLVGKKIKQKKLALGEVQKVNPNMAKANAASRAVDRASGAEPVKAFEALGPEVEKSMWMRFKQTFQTHAGAETLRPLMQNSFDYVRSSIAESAREWRRYDKDLMKAVGHNQGKALQALKSLDTKAGYEVPAGAEDLVRGMRKRIEGLLSGTDLSRWVTGNSAATRGAIPRDAVNDWLKSKGSKFYFDDAEDWMSQWEKSIANAKTPQEAIHQLHQIEDAVKHATAERFMFDNLATLFGNTKGGYTVPHKYLTGVGFESKEMAMEVKRITELVDMMQTPAKSNAFLRVYDQVLRMWKTGMTIYNPAHHIKNFTGDYWLYMADGGTVNDFKNSLKMLNKYKGKAFDPEAGIKVSNKLKDINDPNKLFERIMNPQGNNNVAVRIKSSGMTLTDDQIMAGAGLHGMFQGAGTSEDIVEAGVGRLLPEKLGNIAGKENRLGMSLKNPAGGNIHRGATAVSETRDHSVRLAHFIHSIRNTSVKKLPGMSDEAYIKTVMEDAARRARTHHPDGLDLTQAEKSWGRRLIPFYSWQRKSMPVIIATAWRRPGLVTAYPKAMTAATVGVTGETPDNGFGSLPGDQMFPSWLQENPWAVVGGAAAGTIAEGEAGGGYNLAKGPSVPSNDLVPMMNDPRTMLGQVTPALRTPMELLFGKEAATGIPVETNTERAQLLAKQIPGVSKVVGAGSNQNSNQNDILNWMIGAGLLSSGPYMDSALYEQQLAQREATGNG